MSIYGKWLQLCKGRFLRIADLGADRSERRLSALSLEGLLKSAGKLRLERIVAALPPEPNPLRQSHRLNLLAQAVKRAACMARRSLTNVHIVQLGNGFLNQLGINGCCGQ